MNYEMQSLAESLKAGDGYFRYMLKEKLNIFDAAFSESNEGKILRKFSYSICPATAKMKYKNSPEAIFKDITNRICKEVIGTIGFEISFPHSEFLCWFSHDFQEIRISIILCVNREIGEKNGCAFQPVDLSFPFYEH
jgi:hypothetical protein